LAGLEFVLTDYGCGLGSVPFLVGFITSCNFGVKDTNLIFI
jgi:hypothetical protein